METFKRLKDYYWPYKRLFLISILSLFVVTSVTVIYPLVLKYTIDDVFGQGQYGQVPYLAIGFILLMGVKGVAVYYHQYFGDLFGVSTVYELRNELYTKLQYLPFRYYDSAKTGDLMSRLAGDVEVFRFFLSFGLAQCLNFLLLIGFGFAIMLYLHPSLALVTFIAMPFVAITAYRFDKQVHVAFKEIREAFSALTTKVQENISGMSTVKALSQEDFEITTFTGKNKNYKDNHISTAKIWSSFFPIMELIGNICVVALLVYGGWLVIHEQMKLGELVAFFSLVWFIIGPLMQLGFILNSYSQSKAAGERLLQVLDERDLAPAGEEQDAPKAKALNGHVTFSDVSLVYNEANEKALHTISFDAPPGKVIGLIGATGAGKTSVTQLISRFYAPSTGTILIDGKNIANYGHQELRKNIGVVFQESFLFSCSIYDNIAYGNPHASLGEVVSAAKYAQAHEFIAELPDGYDTLLGERGLGLSGGQKQRIAIARAFLTKPSILILDDATSAVDMETEFMIQQALREVMVGRTTFIIAHRISSLKHADEILVLDRGQVIERGTHEQLLALTEGSYRRIYHIQYQDQLTAMQERTGEWSRT
ncbi:putative ABC transporter ATP-binding protein YknU [Brevibacillus reuszeri]|uniref:ABC transporter ATP-binding protein YknU n=1 Tax=Brevibacillus reuszeri TaxID=54915 RepID=A0A0K9YMJ5_9BACL|nr:ABC transporter ATP-binding protein [Brevibacillus reuszeri]KNB69862.1 multidrug ABC transporter ATP-binding protein [Brevibacillus reuszeri]MED1858217.1 ABC transporter ATP-binding protein [Brevibacillus reuszeri]GED68789.1 putative ABC transporter ATP-binding protein YknU [Brevibacillus reuszeri]